MSMLDWNLSGILDWNLSGILVVACHRSLFAIDSLYRTRYNICERITNEAMNVKNHYKKYEHYEIILCDYNL